MKYQQSREPAGCGHGILSIFFYIRHLLALGIGAVIGVAQSDW
jgi:hypothetical protein